jgi:hypothetical protein
MVAAALHIPDAARTAITVKIIAGKKTFFIINLLLEKV